jgi:hypothetical protein
VLSTPAILSLQLENTSFLPGQVWNDSRIPIIKRYQGHWATDNIAKGYAQSLRKSAYSRGYAIPPSKYSYNAANSAKRNPKGPRGRYNSVVGTIDPKRRKTQPTETDADPLSRTFKSGQGQYPRRFLASQHRPRRTTRRGDKSSTGWCAQQILPRVYPSITSHSIRVCCIPTPQ